MVNSPIFGPFFAMLMLTFIVWVYMYIRRIRYMVTNRIHPQKLTTPEKGAALIAEQVNWAAYNFRNLFEIPVLFYVICLYLAVSASVDEIYVTGGWVFVGLRALHSLVQCTINIVRLRFALYMLSAVLLWAIIFRAAGQYFL
jgi:hypothetical protein